MAAAPTPEAFFAMLVLPSLRRASVALFAVPPELNCMAPALKLARLPACTVPPLPIVTTPGTPELSPARINLPAFTVVFPL